VLAGAHDVPAADGPAAMVAAIRARGRRVTDSVVDGPPPVHLVGHGAGIHPAARLACAAPGDVATLALVGDGTETLPEQLADSVRAQPVPTLRLQSRGVQPVDPEHLADELGPFWDRWDDVHSLLDVTLTAETHEVTRARRLVRAAVENEGVPPSVRDDAELLTSELVTNALVHATAPVRVSVTARADAVSVAVHDAGPASAPAQRRHHGRGLAIVAGLATRCGHWADENGTTAWFWLTRDQASTSVGAATSPRASGPAERPALGSNASHGATSGTAAEPSGHESR